MAKLVFLVDDSPTVRKIVEILLARNGIECKTFPNAETALEAIQTALEASKKIPWTVPFPQLILVDLHLPGMSGMAFIDKLKTIPQIQSKIGICTGRESLLQVPMDGISACIIKPLDDADFVATMKDLLQEKN